MSNETIFGKVFFGGSKRIGRVPEKVAAYLDSFIESIEECDCGFFVWDARSLGTKLNRMDLKRLNKPIFTYRSTTNEFKITRRAK